METYKLTIPSRYNGMAVFECLFWTRCHKSASTIFRNKWEWMRMRHENVMVRMRYHFIYHTLCVFLCPMHRHHHHHHCYHSYHHLSSVPPEWISCFDNTHTHTQFNLCPIDRTWTLNGISQAYMDDFVKFDWCNILIVVFNGQGNLDKIHSHTNENTQHSIYLSYGECVCVRPSVRVDCLWNFCIVEKSLAMINFPPCIWFCF